MAHTHHPHDGHHQAHHPRHLHLFSHEWFRFHMALAASVVARVKRYGLLLGMEALLAVAALLVTRLEAELNLPMQVGLVFDKAADGSSEPMVATGYLPDQFFEQEKQAAIEEPPPQF